MSRATLLALVDSTLTTNGIGGITGASDNALAKAIVNDLYDVIEALPLGTVAVDDASVELNGDDELSIKIPSQVYPPTSPYAFVFRYLIPGTLWNSGVFIKVDGKSIGTDATGALTVLSGVNYDLQSVSDDFKNPIISGDFKNAYRSLGSANGYIKLDTNATADTAYAFKLDLFSPSQKPGFAVKARFNTFSEARACIGLADDVEFKSHGFFFEAEPSSSIYWSVVFAVGGVFTKEITKILFDDVEHEFSSFYNEGVVVFAVDGVEVYSAPVDLTSLDGSLRLGVLVDSGTTEQVDVIIDYMSASQLSVAETSPTFESVPLEVNYIEKRYICKVAQSSTDDPDVKVLVAEFGNPVWRRNDVGIYLATLTGAFLENQVIPKYHRWVNGSGNIFEISRVSDDAISLSSRTSGGTLTDGLLNYEDITISVFTQDITPLT